MRALGLLGAIGLLAGCGGPPPGQCTGPEHCDDGYNCNAADYAGFCDSSSSSTTTPVCGDRGEACTDDQGDPGICWHVASACGVERRCAAACTVGDDSTCKNDGEICRLDGQCTAASCVDEEFTCPADTTCVEAGGDANGCLHPACTDASECGDGQHCVVGRCFLELGECQSDLL